MFVDITQEAKLEQIFSLKNSTKNLVVNTHNIGTHIELMGSGVELSSSRLVGKGIKFDVSHITDRVIEESDIDLSIIEGGEFIFFQTNWDRYLKNIEYIFHPRISVKLIRKLSQMNINMIGVDSPGLSSGKNHVIIDEILTGVGKYPIENLCNLNKLPEKDFKVFCLPMKIDGIDILPARLIVEI